MRSNLEYVFLALAIVSFIGFIFQASINEKDEKTKELILIASIVIFSIAILGGCLLEVWETLFVKNNTPSYSDNFTLTVLTLVGFLGLFVSSIGNYFFILSCKLTSKTVVSENPIRRSNNWGQCMFLSAILLLSSLFLDLMLKAGNGSIDFQNYIMAHGFVGFTFLYALPIFNLVIALRKTIFKTISVLEGILIFKGSFAEKRYDILNIKSIEYCEKRYLLKVLFKTPVIDIKYKITKNYIKNEAVYAFGFNSNSIKNLVISIKQNIIHE